MALASALSRCGRSLLAARQPVGFAAYRWLGASTTASSAEAVTTDEVHGPERGWGTTKIKDLLSQKGPDNGAWLWCSKDDLVIDAVRKMTKGSVGSLLVFDPTRVSADAGATSQDAVCGIITERDYLTKMVVQGKSSLSTHVQEIMTPGKKLVVADPGDTVVSVMETMCVNNIRHVPVVEAGNMVGMLSMRDMIAVVVKEHRDEVGQLQEFIAGTY